MTHRIAIAALLVVAVAAATPAHSAARMPGSLQFTPYAGMAWYMAGFELGPWDQYLLQELTPELDRLAPRQVLDVSWLQLDDEIILPAFAVPLLKRGKLTTTALTFRQSSAGMLLGDTLEGVLRDARRFEQKMLMPGLTHRVSDHSALTVSAVLASQRFGMAEMNLRPADDAALEFANGFDPRRTEVAQGTGLRFALSSELTTGVRLEAAFQSRINMDEFASMHGVHGASAELDIPPRLQLGLQFLAGERSWFNMGIDQIFYSDIGAYPSRSMPARFNALLGDRNSPQFAWNDLTVYSLGWHWQVSDGVELFVDYRTRTQPSPSAATLARALDPELASNALLAGLSKSLSERTRLRLNAAYAPPEFAFGGNLLGVVSDSFDQELEVQAILDFDF